MHLLSLAASSQRSVSLRLFQTLPVVNAFKFALHKTCTSTTVLGRWTSTKIDQSAITMILTCHLSEQSSPPSLHIVSLGKFARLHHFVLRYIAMGFRADVQHICRAKFAVLHFFQQLSQPRRLLNSLFFKLRGMESRPEIA